MSAPPVVPPRPSKGSEATSPPAPPSIPARPARNRSPLPQGEAGTSENPESVQVEEPSTTSTTTSTAETKASRPSSPEQRRKIDPDLDLHQPMAVRPTTEEASEAQYDESNLPPEIGQRVPMLPYAGDVQAPSPGPSSRSVSRNKRRSQHGTKTPHGDQPEGMIVGDFGAYPSGQNVYKLGGTYSLSRDDLTRSVQPQANPAGVATTPGLEGVPDEEIGYAAADELASRDATPIGTPGVSKLPTKSPLSQAVSTFEGEDDDEADKLSRLDAESDGGIYGKGGSQYNASSTSLKVPSGRHTPHNGWEELQDEHADGTPILASDEAGKSQYFQPPAVSPRLTAQELRRPGSVGKQRQSPSIVPEDDISEPSSPIREHVPLFPKDGPPRPPSRPKLDKQGSSQFPSKDIWEDAPESTHATYEVEESEEPKNDDGEYYNPRAKKAEETAVPEIPSRPVKKTSTDESTTTAESKQAPIVPDRPRIPPRPGKKPGDASSTEASSPEEARSPPILKPKPVVPAKGGIAALRANFMNDLNSRLSKGPQAPKKEEVAAEAPEAEPKEREPLEDVRKSRARGPAKRKPTTATDSAAPAEVSIPKLTFSSIITVYSIGDDYEVSFDETKFDDEPSKIARPIEKLAAGLKSATTEEIDTTKEVVVSDEAADSKPEVPAADKAVAA